MSGNSFKKLSNHKKQQAFKMLMIWKYNNFQKALPPSSFRISPRFFISKRIRLISNIFRNKKRKNTEETGPNSKAA